MTTATPPRFLLLVPAVAENTLSAFRAGFGDTLSQVLKEVASHSEESSGPAILEIAYACPQLVGVQQEPRSSLYKESQRLISLLYKLVVLIAARDQVNVEDAQGVDVRIILVAWDPNQPESSDGHDSFGPVINLHGLAHSKRPWQFAFGIENDAGEALVKAFVAAKTSGKEPVDVVSNEKAENSTCATSTGAQVPERKHHDVAVGGTFDHLHIGHKLLLTMTLFAVDIKTSQSPASATVGITGDELLKNKKYAEVLESWDKRQKAVENFCDSILDFTSWPSSKKVHGREDSGPNGKSVDLQYGNGLIVKCTEIQDPFGPTITDEAISALIISAETRSGGKAVNQKRTEKGWAALDVFEVDVLDAEEETVSGEGFEAKLSSTAIRKRLAATATARP